MTVDKTTRTRPSVFFLQTGQLSYYQDSLGEQISGVYSVLVFAWLTLLAEISLLSLAISLSSYFLAPPK
jgi:hypothetical protein